MIKLEIFISILGVLLMFPNDFKGIEYLQILNEYFYAYK